MKRHQWFGITIGLVGIGITGFLIINLWLGIYWALQQLPHPPRTSISIWIASIGTFLFCYFWLKRKILHMFRYFFPRKKEAIPPRVSPQPKPVGVMPNDIAPLPSYYHSTYQLTSTGTMGAPPPPLRENSSYPFLVK